MIRALSAAVVVALARSPRSRRRVAGVRDGVHQRRNAASGRAAARVSAPRRSALARAVRHRLRACAARDPDVRRTPPVAASGSWASFAVRYGGGDYTTFGRCVAYKTDRAAARVGAGAEHALEGVCGAVEQSAPRVVVAVAAVRVRVVGRRRPLLRSPQTVALGLRRGRGGGRGRGASGIGERLICHNLAVRPRRHRSDLHAPPRGRPASCWAASGCRERLLRLAAEGERGRRALPEARDRRHRRPARDASPCPVGVRGV